MRAIRSKGGRAELLLRRALWRRGLRYRLHDARYPGRPDLVFPRYHTIVFVDGDFWHGRPFIDSGEEALRSQFSKRVNWWVRKLRRNVERDREVNQLLQMEGWRVIRVWETTIKADPEGTADRIVDWITDNQAQALLIRC